MPGRKPRRDKAAQKKWLEDKRLQAPDAARRQLRAGAAGAGKGAEAKAGRLSAEEDFRACCAAQHLFGEGPNASSEFEALWQTLHSPLPVTVRVNQHSPLCELTESRLASEGWVRRREFDQAGLSIWQMADDKYSGQGGCKSWAERENRIGSFSFQELVSLVPAVLLAPTADHLCLDLCAAPGSKSGQLLEGMAAGVGGLETKGVVLSADSDAKRCCLALHRNLAKGHWPSSCAALVNAKDFPVLLDHAGGCRMPYDRILVDVPCSGDGTVRKNAQLWRSWARTEALKLFTIQRNILGRALFLLPPGGILAYSTCSLNPVENEAVVLSALRRWRGRGGAPVELLDTVEACRARCGLPATPGVDGWLVPSPGRGEPMFARWEDVPEALRADSGGTLRPDMFADGEAPSQATAETPSCEMRRCARFYPHRGDTGGFFVALLRKLDTPAASLPAPVGRDDAAEPRARSGDGITGGGACTGGRTHPLLTQRFSRVRPEDPAWQELSEFFGLDADWAEDKLRRGLLFWQTVTQGGQPGRVALASEGVARLHEAAGRCADKTQRWIPWVRLGAFIFEQLPRGLLAGAVACRWRVASEGAALVAGVLGRRRVVLPPSSALRLLLTEHRQGALEELPAGEGAGATSLAASAVPLPGGCAVPVAGEVAAHWPSDCGAVLVRVQGWEQWPLPGVLTPRTLRLLVDEDHAASLADALVAAGVRPAPAAQRQPPSRCATGCWVGALRGLRRLAGGGGR